MKPPDSCLSHTLWGWTTSLTDVYSKLFWSSCHHQSVKQLEWVSFGSRAATPRTLQDHWWIEKPQGHLISQSVYQLLSSDG